MFTTMNTKPRTLLLADVENLVGSALPLAEEVVETRQQVLNITSAIASDSGPLMSVIACSHVAAGTVRFAWPEGLHRWKSGRDGADLALLGEASAIEWSDGGFETVVIGSGDGIFSDLAAWLLAQGVEVIVIARRDAMSRELRLAVGGRVRYLAEAVMEGVDRATA